MIRGKGMMTWMDEGGMTLCYRHFKMYFHRKKKKKVNRNANLDFYQSTVIKTTCVFHLIQLG